MSFDFRARQVRVNQIINSGSVSTSPLLIYGAEAATDLQGGTNPLHFPGLGSDVWLYVSGTRGAADNSYGAVSFRGDVVVSGALQIGDTVAAPSTPASGKGVIFARTGSLYFKDSLGNESDLTAGVSGGDVYWQSTAANIIFTTGSAQSLFVSSSTGLLVTGSSTLTGSLTITGSLKVYAADEGTIILSSSLGESGLSHVSDGNLYLTNNTRSGNVTFSATNSTGLGRQLLVLQAGATTGNLFLSGSTYLGKDSSDFLFVNAKLASDIIPDSDRTRNLGSATVRFANIYTGDLHLRNDRGDWTVIEEETFLRIVNNKTGKNFKIVMEPLD